MSQASSKNLNSLGIRIFRNPLADYYRGDLTSSVVYNRAFLERLKADGFNAVWMHVKLADMVPFRSSLTERHKRNLSTLSRIAMRASKHGVGIYLYLNEPRALAPDDPFWTRFPEARGEPGRSAMDHMPSTRAMCTSTDIVRDYIRECTRDLFRRVPQLAGAFLITASEQHTHCYSHVIVRSGIDFASDQEHAGIHCPRCMERKATDIVAEILNLVRDGVREAGSNARIIAWNWSWSMYAPDPQEEILRALDKDIVVMGGFERGGWVTRGKRQKIEEYSLSYVGPSNRFTRLQKAAAKYGHPFMAKLQVGTTHELATVPNLPLIGNIYRKLKTLHERSVAGFLGCWNFGSFPTLNTAAVRCFLDQPSLDRLAFIRVLMHRHFGSINDRMLMQAVNAFEQSFAFYPLHNAFLYHGPMNFAPGLPLDIRSEKLKPLTATWENLPRGNDWDQCLGNYTLEQVLDLLEQMIEHWMKGFALYAEALFPGNGLAPLAWGPTVKTPCIPLDYALHSDRDRLRTAKENLPSCALQQFPVLRKIEGLHRLEEWCSAYAVGACIRSARNVLAMHGLRRITKANRRRRVFGGIAEDERENLKGLLNIMRIDARIGFHGECQEYLFTALQLKRKGSSLQRKG